MFYNNIFVLIRDIVSSSKVYNYKINTNSKGFLYINTNQYVIYIWEWRLYKDNRICYWTLFVSKKIV